MGFEKGGIVLSRQHSTFTYVDSSSAKIGKELLLPELPLTLRLIGLRATKLKDLKAPESKTGIKRVRLSIFPWDEISAWNAVF